MQESVTTPLTYVTSERTRMFIHPLLVAVMTGAQFMGLVLIFQLIFPDEAWIMVNVLTFGFAIEGIYTTIWLNHGDRLSLNRYAYRGAELVFLLVVVRLFSWTVLDSWPQMSDLRTYLIDPLVIIDRPFFLSSIITLLAWQRGLLLGLLFHHLAIREYEATYYTLSTTERTQQMMKYSHSPARNRAILATLFFKNWIGGGVFMVLCAALTTFDVPQFADTPNPFDIARFGLRPEMLTAMMLYFIIGFWLLSQVRLTMMKARWMTNGVRQYNNVSRGWRGGSLRLLLIVAFMAAFLPIGSTVPISRILGALIAGVFFVLQLVMVLISIIFAGFLSLFGNGGEGETEAETGQTLFENLPDTVPPEIVPPNETTALVFGSLFWAVIGVITIMAILFFLRDRGYFGQEVRLGQWWHLLWRWLRAFWQGVSEQVEEFQLALRTRLQPKTEAEGTKRTWRFIRVNGLSPREQIRYFYLSTVRRASERGVKRPQSATPNEYAESLTAEWPQSESEVDELTDAFLKARYSPYEIEKEESEHVKAQWKQVRANLRKGREPKDAATGATKDVAEDIATDAPKDAAKDAATDAATDVNES